MSKSRVIFELQFGTEHDYKNISVGLIRDRVTYKAYGPTVGWYLLCQSEGCFWSQSDKRQGRLSRDDIVAIFNFLYPFVFSLTLRFVVARSNKSTGCECGDRI